MEEASGNRYLGIKVFFAALIAVPVGFFLGAVVQAMIYRAMHPGTDPIAVYGGIAGAFILPVIVGWTIARVGARSSRGLN